MFNLTRYRYIFFAISLAVIVPGVLALLFWGLNLGIDFTNGTTIDLRFANANVTTTDVQRAFSKAKAQDVQVYASRQLGDTTLASQYAFIQFSRPIGPNELNTVTSRLNDPKAGLPKATEIYTYFTVKNGAGKPDTALAVFSFDKPVKADAINAALKDLPPTDLPAASSTTATATPGATTTVTPAATTTPAATATASPSATATSTPAAGSSGSTSGGDTFPVSVTNVTLGQNDQTYQINTQTAYPNPDSLDSVVFALSQQYGPAYVVQKSEVGPAVANETTRNAILAVLAASVAILLYIAIAFRKAGNWRLSFRFGASAIVALLHDALVVLGLWAIFGHFFNFKVDTLFLTAVLTVIGFSVHDTIVVFDRIRENLQRRTSESFEQVVDTSLVQTMSRSLNTSLTVLFTLSALTLFGGDSIREFTLALLIGIASGTYSSIFNASMILYVWETGEHRRWFRRTPGQVASRSPRRDVAATRA